MRNIAVVLVGVLLGIGNAQAGAAGSIEPESRGLSPIEQADTSGAGATPQPDFILKVCQETESTGDSSSAMRAVDPAFMLKNYLQNRDRQYVELKAIKTTLLEGTKHGEIISGTTNTGRTAYGYDAEPEYVGKDGAVFMAEYQGVRYKIVVDLRVFLLFDEKAPVCPSPQLIKVTKPSSGTSGFRNNGVQPRLVS